MSISASARLLLRSTSLTAESASTSTTSSWRPGCITWNEVVTGTVLRPSRFTTFSSTTRRFAVLGPVSRRTFTPSASVWPMLASCATTDTSVGSRLMTVGKTSRSPAVTARAACTGAGATATRTVAVLSLRVTSAPAAAGSITAVSR